MQRLAPSLATGLLALALVAPATPARAGVYADDLSRCLVESSTQQDRNVLVKWVFVALAQHPAIASLSKATPADIEKSNAAAAELFTRLLTDTCADKSKKAIKYEGVAAIQGAFGVFGQVATSDLFSNPQVQAVLSGLEKHVDKKKMESLSNDTPYAGTTGESGAAPAAAPATSATR
jgi:hypothetical protein